MIPLRDNIPTRRLPVVTWMLIALNLAAFYIEFQQGERIDAFIYHNGVVPSYWQISTASDFLDWPRLFLTLITSQFLHGGVLHLVFNMLYLWIFGNNVEDKLGRGRFLSLYLGCGVVAAVAQMLVSPHSSVPMVGASGAIAGVLGAYILMFPGARVVTLVPFGFFWHTVEMPAFLFLGLWFLLQWLEGVSAIGVVAEVGGVAFWAHIGGFIAGMAGAVALRARR